MKQAVDLQMHSHYSDGSKSPTELVGLLKKKNIIVASLTDHNTIHGQYEFQAAAKRYKIKTINGVEIYSRYKQYALHLLGYGIDINDATLHDQLRLTQHRRKKMIEQVVPRLTRVGLKLDISELFAQPATYVGIANLVRTMRKHNSNEAVFRRATKRREVDFIDIYNRFFSRRAPCYLPEVSLPMTTAVKLIKLAKGVPVLAHPGWHLSFRNDAVILNLQKLGVRGIECFSSHHNWDQTAHYLMLARQYGLIVTGGSDYHGDLPFDTIIENYYEYTSLPYDIYENIKIF